MGFQEKKDKEVTVACLDHQERKETRVQPVSLDFQAWTAYLVTQGLLDPEANLVWTATMAHEGIPAIQEKEEPLAQAAPLVSLGEREKKEDRWSSQVALKVFRENVGTQDHPAYQDLGVNKDQQGPWGMQVHQG